MKGIFGWIGTILAFVIAHQSGFDFFDCVLRALLGWIYVIARIIMAIDFNILDRIMELMK